MLVSKATVCCVGSCSTQKVHLGQLFKSISSIEFSGYISHCSTLTHMFPQACNMLHKTTSSSLPALTHFTGWMTKSSVTGRRFSYVSVTVCWARQTGMHKRAGTHRSPLSMTGCHCLFRLLRGFARCPAVCGCWAAAAVDEDEGRCCFWINSPRTPWTSNCETALL